MFGGLHFILSSNIPFSRSVPALLSSGVILNSYVLNLPFNCGGVSSINVTLLYVDCIAIVLIQM